MTDDFPNKQGFAWRDLHGEDRWEAFTPTFTSLTVVGATSYFGRVRIVGRQAFFQIKFSAATSIASTAGTTYVALPITAKSQSLTGIAIMANRTSHLPIGSCEIDTDTSRCYIPTQLASGNVFTIAGWYEV